MKKTLIKRVMTVALSILMVLGLMPMTASAIAYDTYDVSGRTQSGNNTAFIRYGLTDDSAGSFSISEWSSYVQFDLSLNDGWYLEKWDTWFNGAYDKKWASDPEYNERNPVLDGKPTFFNTYQSGVLTNDNYIIVGSLGVLYGDFRIDAIVRPILTVNAGDGVNYQATTANPISVQSGVAVVYGNNASVTYTVDDKHVVTGITANHGTQYSVNGSEVTVSSVVRPATVNISSRLKQQKINFNANGGEGTMNAQTFEHSVAQALSANSFTRQGYTFAGWNTESNGSGTTYADKAFATFTPKNDGDSITLYAQWTQCTDHNWLGGVCTECGTPCSHSGGSATCTEQATCATCGEKHGGIDPDAHSYDRATHICAYCGETEEFMATWTTGDGDSYEKMFAFGEVITIPNNEYFEDTFVKTGYTLVGWTDYMEEMTMPAASVTFTAVYAPVDYTVSFYVNGGDEIESITVTYDEKYGRLPSSSVTGLSGGDSNWYLMDQNGNVTDTKITRNTVVEQTRNHTLFVKRKVLAPTVSLSLSVPGGISDSYNYYIPGNSSRILMATVGNQNNDILEYTYQWYKDGVLLENENGATLTLLGNVSDAGNYKVVVTATLKDGTGIVVTENTASGEKEMKVKILHAANELKYDANGGEGGPSANYTGGTTATVSFDKPNREHYVFTGWNTKADGTGDTYAAGAAYTFENDGGNGGCVTTLYAQWKLETKTVTYMVNGEVYKTETVEYGKDATLPEVPLTEGHSGKWDHDGKNITEDTVIHAVYTANKYRVTFKIDGEVVDTQTVEYGKDATAPAIPEKVGYTQTAPTWDKDGKNITADTEINAVYTINEYTVSFKAEDAEIGTETVKHGNDATLPEIPKKDGYVGKWDADGKGITADTVINAVYTQISDAVPDDFKPEDKTDLEDTKNQLEDMLKDNGYTEDDKKVIQNEIDRIDDALEVIENVENVEDLIGKLPENITKNDEAAIKAADDAYNALTDYEKSLVDEEAKKTLDDAKAALAELNKPADANSPQTGDNSNIWLWIALLFVSGAGIFGITLNERKRRTASKR